MSQIMVRGDINPIRVLAKASTNLTIGDSVFLSSSNGVNANAYNSNDWGSATAAVKHALAKTVFMGISMDARTSLQTVAGNILCATTGFANAIVKDEAAKDIGTMYTFTNAATNGISNNSFESTTNATTCVARLAEAKPANQLTAILEIYALTAATNGL